MLCLPCLDEIPLRSILTSSSTNRITWSKKGGRTQSTQFIPMYHLRVIGLISRVVKPPLWTFMHIRLLGLSWLLLAMALGVCGQSADWAFRVDFSVLPRPDAGDRAEGSSDPAGGIEKGHCGRQASRWTMCTTPGAACCWHISCVLSFRLPSSQTWVLLGELFPVLLGRG